jgi:curli biogenesis system outer membrane secretion channel CsgG
MRSFALAVSAAALVLPGQLMAKPTVAVSQIEAGNNEELANNFTVMVETAVETSNKFRVIERRQLGNLVNEQAMGNSGMVTTNTPGQRGGLKVLTTLFMAASPLAVCRVNTALVRR